MPASIFAGSKVKTLKSTLSLNGGADVISSTVDPTAVAVDASPGSLLLNTTTGKQYRKNDSGSSTNWTEVGAGTSGINYITNPSAATNTTGWATYADAAGAIPVDGTGGSPTVTWTRSTTTPLRGAADFNFTTPGGGSVQGQGVSTDFIIDLADQAKVLTVTFDYEVLSGTYSSGDLTCYLIADPAGTPSVIQPAGYVVQAATVGTKMRQIATFQTNVTGQTYRLCLHVASTSTAAYVLAVDNVSVGPQVVQYGAPVTDWQDFPSVAAGTLITATTTSPTFGTVQNNKARWRRVGGDMEIRWDFRQSTAGTAGSGVYLFNLPAGFSIDSARAELFSVTGSGDSKSLGTIHYFDPTSTTFGTGYLYARTATQLSASFQYNAASTSYGVGSWSSTFASFGSSSTIEVSFIAKVPILGWSSTVQMSNDTDTRVVAAAIGLNTNQTISTATFTKIALNSVVLDTHGGWDSVNSKYTVTVPGIYEFSSNVTWGTTATGYRTSILYKNGSRYLDLSSVDNPSGVNSPTSAGKSPPIPALAGDFFELYVYQTSGAGLNVLGTAGTTLQTTNLGVRRLSGPSAIAASETVAAVYKTASGQSIPNAAFTVVDYTTKEIDTHGAVTTGAAWKFTAPISGTYCVSAKILFNTAASSTGGSYLIALHKGGTLIGEFGRVNGTGASNFFGPTGSRNIFLLAGEFIDIRASQDSGGARTLFTSVEYNHVSIHRIGN